MANLTPTPTPTMTPTVPPTIEGDGKPSPGRRLTEAEFVAWVDDKTRAEWTDGEVEMMSPVSRRHVDLDVFLLEVLRRFTRHHQAGEVFGPEYQVVLPPDRRRRTPDILFVARSRLDMLLDNQVEGPPDLIIEIVSAESLQRDTRDKFVDYQNAGVVEYWLILPGSTAVDAYHLDATRRYQPIPLTDGRLHSSALRGFWLRPAWLWQTPRPDPTDVLRELGVTTLPGRAARRLSHQLARAGRLRPPKTDRSRD